MAGSVPVMSSVSGNLHRMKSPTGKIAAPRKKGIRHPHASSDAASKELEMTAAKIAAHRTAPSCDAYWSEV
jgi:hypothetical protein